MCEPTRIVAVDDDPSVIVFLESAFGVEARHSHSVLLVGSTNDAEEGLALCEATEADLALVDYFMPGQIGGVELIRQIVHQTKTTVACLSSNRDPEAVMFALKAGATGFIRKAADPCKLISPIVAIAQGYTILPTSVREFVFGARAEGDPDGRLAALAKLTPDERTVLEMLADGACDREIQEELVCSRSKVSRAIAHIKEVTGASRSDRMELREWAEVMTLGLPRGHAPC